MTRSTILIIVVLVLLLAIPNGGYAADPARTCAKRKLDAAAKRVANELKCFGTAAGKGVSVDPKCLTKAETTFGVAFVKAEAKGGCPTVGDVAAVEGLVDTCVGAVRAALGTSAQKNACLKAKLGAAAKKAASKVQCSAKAATKGLFADPVCLTKAETAFVKEFAKRDAKGGCVTSNDAASVEAIIDGQCVSPLVGALPVPIATPSPIRTATPVATPTNNGCAENPPALWAANLAEQNDVRATAIPVPAPPLAPFCWKASLATTAQGWADNCTFMHNPNLNSLGLGENLYACVSTSASCAMNAPTNSAVLWGNEDVSYDYTSNSCLPALRCQGGSNDGALCSEHSQCPEGLCFNECGHYTQMVWRSTESTGCAVKSCSTGSPFPGTTNWTLVVCNYDPPGNFIGQRPY